MRLSRCRGGRTSRATTHDEDVEIVPLKLAGLAIVDLPVASARDPDAGANGRRFAVEAADYNRWPVRGGKVPVEFRTTPDRVRQAEQHNPAVVHPAGQGRVIPVRRRQFRRADDGGRNRLRLTAGQ